MAKCINCKKAILTAEELADKVVSGEIEYHKDLYSDEYLQLEYADDLYFCEDCMDQAVEIHDLLHFTKSPVDRIRAAETCREMAESYEGAARLHLLKEIDYLTANVKNGYAEKTMYFPCSYWLDAAESAFDAAKSVCGSSTMVSLMPVRIGNAIGTAGAFEQKNRDRLITLNLQILQEGDWCAVTAVTHGIDKDCPWREQGLADDLMDEFWEKMLTLNEVIALYDRIPKGDSDE